MPETQIADRRYRRLGVLGTVLMARFRHHHSPDDLEDAAAAIREAVATAPAAAPYRAACLSQLAVAYTVSFEQDPQLTLLEEALAIAHSAVEAANGDNFHTVEALHELVKVLDLRFTWTHEMSDLYETVDALRRCVAITHPGSTRHTVTVAQLADALRSCFYHDRNQDLLDEAIQLLQHAVVNGPNESVARVASQIDLAQTLRERFEHSRNRMDLDFSVRVSRQAAAASEGEGRLHSIALTTLASVLRLRFLETEHLADLDEATTAAEKAVNASTRQLKGDGLSTLGIVLRQRHRVTAERKYIDRAIDVLRQAVVECPEDGLNYAPTLENLGNSLYDRWLAYGHPDGDANDALDAWDQAVSARLASSAIQVSAARSGANFAARRQLWPEASERYSKVMALLPSLAWHGLNRRDGERVLSAISGMLEEMCATEIERGDDVGAVLRLEEARGILWSRLLDAETDLASLRAVRPDLADHLQYLRERLDTPSSTDRFSFDPEELLKKVTARLARYENPANSSGERIDVPIS